MPSKRKVKEAGAPHTVQLCANDEWKNTLREWQERRSRVVGQWERRGRRAGGEWEESEGGRREGRRMGEEREKGREGEGEGIGERMCERGLAR
eukprot:2384740-Rhodomonas_salina.1